MQFALENSQQLKEMYVDKQMSASDIAETLGTYTLKITRALKFLQIPIRNKSETQALVLKSIPHPTKGKKMSEATKVKISDSVHAKWTSFSEDKRQQIKDECRERWENYSEEHKETLRKASVEGIRKSSKEGSKLERFLTDELNAAGYTPFHHYRLPDKEKLEVDIYVPEIKVAIEIDGPSHYLPIWGQEALGRVNKADMEKNGLLVLNGYVVIRIKYLVNKATDVLKRNLVKALVGVLDSVKAKFPPANERIIYLDIETGEIE